MELVIRKMHIVSEEILFEGMKRVETPIRLGAVGAVLKNPYAGRYVEDLSALGNAGIQLGTMLSERLVSLMGGPGNIAAFGKGVIVGTNGEAEHGSVLIHGKDFGDTLRLAAQGDMPIPSAEKLDSAGATMDIPMKTKVGKYQRAHHQNFTVRVQDAPLPDEILVVLAASSGGRPHPR